MSAVASRMMPTGEHRLIPIKQLSPSPLNHRKHFDPKKMADLTDNVRLQGVVVPIVARPMNGAFEIVAGERRYRAAKEAGLLEMPAIVRELSDAQAVELQVIENQQRVDVSPLEEAEGYAALLKCTHPDGSRYTVDEIANKVSMSKSHVYQRIKLASLCPAARDALQGGRIDASVAVLIARIPNEGLQRKVLEEVVGNEYRSAMSYKRAQELIRDKYMLRLADAPFDVKAIYFKGKTAEALAPKCGECPKRTGNQAELFADIDSGDVCTDTSCFEAKRLAHTRMVIDEAEKAGRTVLRGEEAKKIIPNTWGDPTGGYLKLDGICYDDDKSRTYRQILGKKASAEHSVLLESPHGKGDIIELVKAADVKALLAEKGVKAPKREASFNTSEDRAARQKEKEEREREAQVAVRIRAAIHRKHTGALGKPELAFFVDDLLESASMSEEDEKALLELWGWDSLDAKKIDALSAKDLARLLLDLTLASHYRVADLMGQLAKSLRVDVEKIKRDVAAEAKATSGLEALGIKAKKAKKR